MLEDSFRPFRGIPHLPGPPETTLVQSSDRRDLPRRALRSFDRNTPPVEHRGDQEAIRPTRNSRYNINKMLNRNMPDQFTLDGEDDDRTCQNLSRRPALSFVIRAN
jgi:hypothetical protein